MHDRRWYPTRRPCPTAGPWSPPVQPDNTLDYDPIPEVYDPNTQHLDEAHRGRPVIPNYAFMFVLPDGRVLAAGSDEAKMGTYALNVATQTWSVVDSDGSRCRQRGDVPPGKIMKSGSSYIAHRRTKAAIPSKATTYVLDMTQATPRGSRRPRWRTHVRI